MTLLATLGSEEGEGAFEGMPSLARDSRGRFYAITPRYRGGVPRVFDAGGRYLRGLGREGEGPGEFLWPTAILVTGGDTLHVLDSRNGRVTVLDSSYTLVRTITRIPGATQGRVFRSDQGDYVMTHLGGGTDIIIYDQDAHVTRFSTDGPGLGRNGESARYLSPPLEGTFWVARFLYEYEFTLWTVEGTLLRTLSPESSWFEPYDSINVTPSQPPPSEVHGVWQDDGRLWVVGAAKDPDWLEGVGELVRGPEGTFFHHLTPYKVWDPIIEVLDAESGHSIAHRRLDDPYEGIEVIAPGFIAGFRRDELGWWYADVWRVEFQADGDDP